MKGSSRESCDDRADRAGCRGGQRASMKGSSRESCDLLVGGEIQGQGASMKGSSRESCDNVHCVGLMKGACLNEGQLPRELRPSIQLWIYACVGASMKGSSRESCDGVDGVDVDVRRPRASMKGSSRESCDVGRGDGEQLADASMKGSSRESCDGGPAVAEAHFLAGLNEGQLPRELRLDPVTRDTVTSAPRLNEGQLPRELRPVGRKRLGESRHCLNEGQLPRELRPHPGHPRHAAEETEPQ